LAGYTVFSHHFNHSPAANKLPPLRVGQSNKYVVLSLRANLLAK
jgi:hypothetical protein